MLEMLKMFICIISASDDPGSYDPMFKVYFPLKKICFNENTFFTKIMHFNMQIHNFFWKAQN